MSKAIKPVGIVSVLLLMFILFYVMFVVPWDIEPTERSKFSKEQQAEICDKLKFELVPGETISTQYWPGMMQATISLTVTVYNIRSKEDFLKRVYFETPLAENNWADKNEALYFDDFQLLSPDHRIKDYSCSVRFIEENGTNSAKIHVSGYVTQLSSIYNFLYEPWQPYLSDRLFISLTVVECVLILFLVAQIPVYLLKHRKNATSV